MANYFLDGTNLSDSTSVYTDAGLTTCAPDGFYSNGTIVREQVGCELLPAQICPTCPTPTEPCGGNINASGNQGIYLLNVDTGDTPTDVGAIIVRFDPYGVPDGVRATYNGVVFNKLSSPVDGYHGSTNPNNPTFIGNTGQDCGISGSSYTLDEYQYSGGSFVATGNTQNITVDAGDVSLGNSPGDCVMVIPKTLPTPSDIALEFIGPCSGTIFNISVSCPILLPSFQSSTVQPTSSVGCSEPLTETYYFAKVHTAVDTFVGLYDYVFVDEYGATPLANGFYLISNVAAPNKVIEVVNGIVVAFTDCVSSGLSPFAGSQFRPTEQQACALTTPNVFYHTGNFAYPALGDTLYLNNLAVPANLITNQILKSDDNNAYTTDSNGIVIIITDCSIVLSIFNSVIALDDCNDQTGIATTITDIDEVNVAVGTQLQATSGGNLTPLATGNYRMSRNLVDGQVYNLGSIIVSDYIVQVDNNGFIINIIQC